MAVDSGNEVAVDSGNEVASGADIDGGSYPFNGRSLSACVHVQRGRDSTRWGHVESPRLKNGDIHSGAICHLGILFQAEAKKHVILDD